MKTEHALRYLLLRHMERFESVVPRETFVRVVRSLRVEADREGFDVRWNDGQERQRRFPRSAFSFYARGDRGVGPEPDGAAPARTLANRNDATARAFAEQVFGCQAPALAPAWAPAREPYRLAACLGAAALFPWLFAVGGLPALASALLAGWLLLEHLPHGRLVACAPLLLLSALAAPWAGVLGALACGALQLLDPDTRWRRLRVALCASAFAIAALRVASATPVFGAPELLAVAAAPALAAWRSLFASHFRAVPLALPFCLAGLALGGETRAAWVGLAWVLAGNVALAGLHRLRPVRRGA